jgi:hypothetical protein
MSEAEDFFLQDDVPVNAIPRVLADTYPHLAA